MCGIFGLIALERSGFDAADAERALTALMLLSERRGREAAGIALRAADGIHVLRAPGRAETFVRQPAFRRFMDRHLAAGVGPAFAAIGHTRLVTNGWQTSANNNQPVMTERLVGVHNGIIVNDRAIWAAHPGLPRESDVDTESLFRLIESARAECSVIADAVVRGFAEIEGTANIAFFAADLDALYLATNNGSLYYAHCEDSGVFVFASERDILKKALASPPMAGLTEGADIRHLQPGRMLEVSVSRAAPCEHALDRPAKSAATPIAPLPIRWDRPDPRSIRRCARCVLTDTFPGIFFDAAGVCSVCRDWRPFPIQGREALEKLVAPYRRADGAADCIVAFSGGRDSSYGLHYLKRELGLNPVAFTYDWGMVTDIARRNISRVCARLGVEHIIRSPDIMAKRRYIRLNLQAWLKNPDLGMIPLLMAGDKQFYHHARQLRQETGISLVFFCAGNPLERTEFKSGFCGVRESQHGQVLWRYSLANKLQLAWYYLRQYVRNPAYWNESVPDTLRAYWSTYVARDDFAYFYHYIPWDEKTIAATLKHEYRWEEAGGASTWRIGDGTAAFYNYIYYTIAGFSEHDTFRANQVRAGLIGRDEALALAERDNAPRWAAMEEYARLVGFNLTEALQIVDEAQKLYS